MKTFQRILVLALALLMLCTCAVAEPVTSTGALDILKAEQVGTELDVYLYMDNATPLEQTTLSLYADNQQFLWDTVTPLSKTDQPTTWLVLVDNSTIGLQDGDKALLNGLVGTSILPKDNVVFMVPGDTLENVEVLDQKDPYKNWINSVKYDSSSNKESLIAGIETALNFLASDNEKLHERKCLVIVSNVKKRDDKKRSFTELETLIKDSGVTIYTVITDVDTKPTEATQADYNAYEMMAIHSVNGKSMRTPERSVDTAPNYVEIIRHNENCFYLINADLSQQEIKGSKLKVSLIDGDHPISDEIDCVIDSNGGPGPTPEPPPERNSFIDFVKKHLEYVIIGAGVLVAGLLVLLLIPKKKKLQPIDPGDDEDDPVPPVNTMEETPRTGAPVEPYTPTRPDGSRLTLTVLSGNGRSGSAIVNDSIVVGRSDPKADIDVGNGDEYISHMHVRFNNTNGTLYANNLSRNGTVINGKKITGYTPVKNNDVMTIGHTEYSISWQP